MYLDGRKGVEDILGGFRLWVLGSRKDANELVVVSKVGCKSAALSGDDRQRHKLQPHVGKRHKDCAGAWRVTEHTGGHSGSAARG